MLDAAIHEDGHVSELALSIAWHASLTRDIYSTEGERLVIVFPGHWTHGHGPDFRDAMLERESGALVTGSIELHHHASDWFRHGHHTDPAYNNVVLHVVTLADSDETRRLDGAKVPTAVLRIPDHQLGAVQRRDPSIWSQFGGDICAPRLAVDQPARIRSLLWQLGDTRFDQRVLRFESELSMVRPADALVPALFDAFGYSRNREQMRLLADRIHWSDLVHRLHRLDRKERVQTTLAILLGVAGWIPISPRHAAIARLSPADVDAIEARWHCEFASWQNAVLPPTIWEITRVRPANHPFSRLISLAILLGSHGDDLLPKLIDGIRDDTDPVQSLKGLASSDRLQPLGNERAIAIVASVVLPFVTAYARCTEDDTLEDAALSTWAELPSGPPARPARRARQQVAGDETIRGLRERGHQGLLYLDRHYCAPRRCYECPIARAVVADELATPPATSMPDSA